MVPAPNDDGVFKALRTFLVAILPAGVPVVRGQVNRVPEHKESDFAVIWELRRPRISTNVDSYADTRFTGSIAATVMIVSDLDFGVVRIGATVFGVGVTTNTTIVAQLTGPTGGVGTYTVTPSQTVASRTLASGGKEVMQATQVAMQIDVHGPAGADNAQVISTLLRDEYGVQSFADQSPNFGVVPLYTEDPRQMPFLNAEQQYEDRWIVEAMLQVNPVVSVPQQYADSVAVEVISVDAVFPPS